MSLDDYLTRVPDDDPYGDAAEREDRCPDCGVGPDDPCAKDCGCVYCRRRELLARKPGGVTDGEIP